MKDDVSFVFKAENDKITVSYVVDNGKVHLVLSIDNKKNSFLSCIRIIRNVYTRIEGRRRCVQVISKDDR